jgi:hypothetical protein
MHYKAITEHAQAVGGVTGLARLTEAVKRSSLDVDAVYWECQDHYLCTHITAWKTPACDGYAVLSVTIMRLQPVTDDET